MEPSCELCNSPGGELLWANDFCRIVLAEEPGYADLCRVILNRHVKEMTDLPAPARHRLMDAVFATEAALRETADPHKVNLASLGNAVPHLHWHVIPRWREDPHFPRPIWAEPLRGAASGRACDAIRLVQELKARLGDGAEPGKPS